MLSLNPGFPEEAGSPRARELFAEHWWDNARSTDKLFAVLYDELHRLAEHTLQRRGPSLTLGTTTLLHEAYLNIAGRENIAFAERSRFLAYASRAMRGLVTDYVRHKLTVKHGGELTFTSLDAASSLTADTPVDLDELDRALDDLAAIDPDLASLVDLKFFCGFSFVEIAELRGLSERTVQRDWAKARLLLHQAMSGDS